MLYLVSLPSFLYLKKKGNTLPKRESWAELVNLKVIEGNICFCFSLPTSPQKFDLQTRILLELGIVTRQVIVKEEYAIILALWFKSSFLPRTWLTIPIGSWCWSILSYVSLFCSLVVIFSWHSNLIVLSAEDAHWLLPSNLRIYFYKASSGGLRAAFCCVLKWFYSLAKQIWKCYQTGWLCYCCLCCITTCNWLTGENPTQKDNSGRNQVIIL